MATCAFSANISSVTPVNAELDGDTYQAAPVYNADLSNYNLGSGSGWVTGIQLNWSNEAQNAKTTKASVSDSPDGINKVTEYTVYNNGVKTPSDSGMTNATKTTGNILNRKYWMVYTAWYIYVTPEFMYSLSGADYSATLTIGENTYTITVPSDIILSDGEHQWYPAVGLLGAKVYGDAQYLADQISVENYTTVKFLSEPVGVTFGDGFAASANGDGTWGVTMTHSHAWSFAVSADGTTLTATCGNAGCPVGGATTVSLALSSGDKAYDGTAITASANFDEFFETILPNVSTAITVTKSGELVNTINDAGEYTVTMTVTGLGDDLEYVLSRTVTVSQIDISAATLVLTPATMTYNGTEQTVAPSVTVNGLAATFEVDMGSSTLAATEIGTYSVTVNGTGNFTGTVTATWSIGNTTGALNGVTSAVGDVGSIVNENATNTLTIADSTALEYSGGSWFAGINLEWPVETKGYSGIGQYGYAHYITEGSARVAADEGVFINELAHGSYQYNLVSSHDFDYLSNTTWKVALTPATVEAALGEGKTVLEWTMRAGAIPSDTYEVGVAFADYAIMLPLDEPVVFALGEDEAYDLGATVLTATKMQLAVGASVTSAVSQTEGAIFTTATGYGIVCMEEEGKYVYTTKFTHVHDWSATVAENGYELVATCANPECDINGGEVRMSLSIETGAKEYDGNAVAYDVVLGEGFAAAFQDVATTLTINGNEGVEIRDAGEYEVVLVVSGLGDGKTYELSTAVSISRKDIAGATLALDPETMTYNGEPQTVSLSATVDGLQATFDVDVEQSTTTATEIGTYSVTVNGTGNFMGTATATWSIINTTGEPSSVTASAAGSMTNDGNVFTLSDSSKLEYDSENEIWHAGITITWPMETKDFTWKSWEYHAHYVTEESVKAVTEHGEILHAKVEASYEAWNGSYNPLGDLTDTKSFTYLATTTWKVPLTPAIIEAALAEEKTSLSYTMNAGAFVWGDSTEGDPTGVAFRDYTITIPLEGITLYDGGGRQVYPKTAGQIIIDGLKDDIAEAVSGEVAENAATKIDLLAELVGEGNEQDVADWVDDMKGESPSATFFAELAQSDYVAASFKLETDELITDQSEVDVVAVGTTTGGFTFTVKIDGDDIEAGRVRAAGIIQSATSLDGNAFGPLDANRISLDGNKITVDKDANAKSEFFKIVITKDGSAE